MIISTSIDAYTTYTYIHTHIYICIYIYIYIHTHSTIKLPNHQKTKNDSPVRAIKKRDVGLLQNAVVRGTLLGLQYMGKDKGGKGGVVVNIASIVGMAPLAGSPVYVATKHAVIGLTRSFGVSTAHSNVGVTHCIREAF
jgi:NAD(P)-dependent dehydrogenase (short-subunit alcohol dehydrogenase family)